MRKPKVSLCMPVFNGANFIDEALASICEQTYADFELIVTDNASSDDTADIVRRWAEQDPRIRYIRNDRNIGAAQNSPD
ncbi:glycosyltransferase family 2 protein [Boseongicola aestuarii]|uniref:GalNAc(5)-diNAcBac-PP-undecaprenol beta-1,3-glucosyltransferase n=1 Tax=Boseongicola aestuarii TaxID=1470561 RepID=A0A238J0J0_9RHOB|nr:glycosyltransferase [Boseongicola aestuarii]SMX24228.1 GalNAc(5)-diNAcBac-PP-undecaprenol beta-1,3-glucosyltransferase [Boseongicola aestuarii]